MYVYIRSLWTQIQRAFVFLQWIRVHGYEYRTAANSTASTITNCRLHGPRLIMVITEVPATVTAAAVVVTDAPRAFAPAATINNHSTFLSSLRYKYCNQPPSAVAIYNRTQLRSVVCIDTTHTRLLHATAVEYSYHCPATAKVTRLFRVPPVCPVLLDQE